MFKGEECVQGERSWAWKMERITDKKQTQQDITWGQKKQSSDMIMVETIILHKTHWWHHSIKVRWSFWFFIVTESVHSVSQCFTYNMHLQRKKLNHSPFTKLQWEMPLPVVIPCVGKRTGTVQENTSGALAYYYLWLKVAFIAVTAVFAIGISL